MYRFAVSLDGTEPAELIKTLAKIDPIVALLNTADGESRLHSSRRVFDVLKNNNIETAVMHHRIFNEGSVRDEIVITTGSEMGGLLCDGLGDGLLLEVPSEEVEYLRNTSFGLLQVRTTVESCCLHLSTSFGVCTNVALPLACIRHHITFSPCNVATCTVQFKFEDSSVLCAGLPNA